LEKIFEKPKNVLEAQLYDIFKSKDDSEEDILLKILNILIYKNIRDTTLLDLFRLLNNDYDLFSQILTLFSNRTIRFPDKVEIEDTLLTAVCFYYREIEQMDWTEIKKILPGEISPIYFSAKIRTLNALIKKEMSRMFKQMTGVPDVTEILSSREHAEKILDSLDLLPKKEEADE